ncbi:MAG: DUF3179 domain-containing protein [Saprospiraceae bacterium]|nr:DUF3179 domain-containing protein [Saprospiraceae bacterium]
MLKCAYIFTFVVMIRFFFTALIVLVLNPGTLFSQNIEIKMRILDETTLSPIEGVHLFIENTTFGGFTDSNGEATINLPASMSGSLFISHIGYGTLVINQSTYRKYKGRIDLLLSPSALNLPELVIKSQRNSKWQKQLKKFTKAFLGSDEAADQCKILNPEVLRFDESKGNIHAEATDLIHIDNDFLGYEIYYLLTGFDIDKDGSIVYTGRAQFIDKSKDQSNKSYQENRRKTYLASPKYFFKSLIADSLNEHGFVVEIVSYQSGAFEPLKPFDRDSMFKGPSQTNKYTLGFEEFLKVYNTNFKSIDYVSSGVRRGGIESGRFAAGIQEKKEVVNHRISYLYKVAPYIILNEHGNVLNSQHVKEYGDYAFQKVARQLPFDYGNEYNSVNTEQTVSQPEDNTQTNAVFEWLYTLLYGKDQDQKTAILESMRSDWKDSYAAPLVEIIRLSNDDVLIQNIVALLQSTYNKTETDFFGWLQWLWKQDFEAEDYYFKFKSELYKNIDPAFNTYFDGRKYQSKIRLDEVVWGGVKQDGIPPLRSPALLNADDAGYLDDNDVVFGLYINDIAKAYPKRILAWHEFFTDDFGDLQIAGVYCTLCGTVIAYNMHHDGVFHDLGTSGFLYRSNKLMYDKATQSLWSTIEGQPVIGPLADSTISLITHPVVTTSWGSWKAIHPNTKVLSLNTGYDRDYGEGIAYKDYFSTDNLMFPVIKTDSRLKNKADVLVIRSRGYTQDPLAISIAYLKRKKWYQDRIDGEEIIVLCDDSGAARAYEGDNIKFKSFKNGKLFDLDGNEWHVNEDSLSCKTGKTLKRLAAHNIFWFAWYNAYPNTRLIK